MKIIIIIIIRTQINHTLVTFISALWPSDGDLLLITEPCFTDKMCMTIAQLLPYRDCDFTSIYRAALREGEYIFNKFSFLCELFF